MIFLLLALTVLPFRLYHLSYPLLDAFNFRQTQTATFALNFYKNGINLLQTELDIFGIGKERYLTLEFPLYEAFVAILYKIFFVSDVWGRIVSIAAGYIGALYLYKLVYLVTGNKTVSLFSCFFFLFSPLNMFYQRSFMIEPMIIAFLLSGSYYFCRYVKYSEWKSYLLAVILLTIGFLQKLLYAPFWLLPLILYQIKLNSIRSIFSFKFIIGISILFLSVFLWQKHVDYINTNAGQQFFTSTSFEQWIWNFGTLADRFSISSWQYRLRHILNGILLKPGLLIFLVGMFLLPKFDKTRFLSLLFVSQIIYFLTLFRIQAQNYYQLVLIPAFSPIMSIGLVYISQYIAKVSTKTLSFIFIVAFSAIYIFRSWTNILPSFTVDWPWYQRIQNVGKVTPANSYGIFAVPGNDWNSVFTYYSGRKLMTVGVENLTQANIFKWKSQGYSFLVLHDYNSYISYLKEKDPNVSLVFLDTYEKVLESDEFKVYLFK